MNGEDITRIVAVAMCLVLIVAGVRRGAWNVRNTSLTKLAVMLLVWVGLIVLAAWIFRDYRR